MTRVVVVSDTHAPARWWGIPDELLPALHDADLILHAGDVCVPSVLDELAAFAPVAAVQGNNDGPAVAVWGAAPTASIEVDGVRIAMIHDSGPKERRAARMAARFPEADLVVFGHSHIPWHTVEDVGGRVIRLINPGSLTDPRRQPAGSYAVLSIEAGEVGCEFIAVPRRPRNL